ncbi:MAG: glycosyltransferase family 2 protein [Deltaproteobacteria bacterium]|nr:glycosyltransferase family 2 protein [Deltaproteobacteria bacterium]
MDKIEFSVIIITRNRANYLPKTLNSLLNQDFPKEKYEIIVVDNNSSDDTKLVVERISRSSHKKIQYILEPQIGMSYARNKGASIAKGKILAFIDDDAIASPVWISAHYSLYKKFSFIGATGGKIELSFLSNKPNWLSKDLLIPLGYLDYSLEESIMSYPSHPFGGNFSVKKEIFFELNGFIEKFKSTNEERAFFYKLNQKGYKIGYSPKAIVYHQIPSSRLKKYYFIKRGIKQGMANIKLLAVLSLKDPPPLKQKLYRFFLDAILIIRNRIFFHSKYSFSQIYYFCILLGEILGLILWRVKRNEYNPYSNPNGTS